MSFRGVHSSSPVPMHTIPSASTRRHFDSFELLRGATPKPQFLPTVDPITTGPTGELREFGKRRREAGGRRAGHTGPINEHRDKAQQDTHLRPRDSEQVRDDRAPRDRWGAPARRLVEVTAPRRFASRRIVPRDYTEIAASSTAPGADHCARHRPLRLAEPGSTRGTRHRGQHSLSPALLGHALPYREPIKSGPHSRHPTGRHPNIQGVRVKNRTVIARIDSTADSWHKKLPIAKLSGVIRCGDRI